MSRKSLFSRVNSFENHAKVFKDNNIIYLWWDWMPGIKKSAPARVHAKCEELEKIGFLEKINENASTEVNNFLSE